MRSGPRKAPDDAVRAAHQRYLTGTALSVLANELGYKNAGTLTAAFRRLRLPRLGRAGVVAYMRLSDPKVQEALALWDTGMTAKAAGEVVGLSQTIMTRVLRETDRDGQRWGAAHPAWRGGRHTAKGYICLRLEANHPLAAMRAKGGQVMEHRLVMAEHLGRPLTLDETVHHINGVRDDNRIENLQLRIGRHGSSNGWCCAECGSTRLKPVPLS